MKKFLTIAMMVTSVLLGTRLPAAESPAASAVETIAIIGTGRMGSTLGKRWAAAGHTIVYGSRDPQRAEVRELLTATGTTAIATTPADAARRAGIVVIAVPWEGVQDSARSLGDLAGKIVIDVTNPLVFDADRDVEVAVPHSGAELIRDWLPGAQVVKAFNTVNWAVITEPRLAGGPVTVALAGDDAKAKERVGRLVAQLGLEPFDAGRLANARYLEGMALLYVNMLVQDPPRRFEYYLRSR